MEAIFIAIYVYGWDRLPPRVHLACGVPIVIAGITGAGFVISVNGWMNKPEGSTPERRGRERQAVRSPVQRQLLARARAHASGLNAKAVSTILGHASIAITMDRYGHLFPGSENEAGKLLDRYINGH
jgi:cytochrome bd-type quinol oxidase subunit 1